MNQWWIFVGRDYRALPARGFALLDANDENIDEILLPPLRRGKVTDASDIAVTACKALLVPQVS